MLDKDTSLNGSMHHSTLIVSCDRRQNSNHHYMASLNFCMATAKTAWNNCPLTVQTSNACQIRYCQAI